MERHTISYWLAAIRLPNIGPVTMGLWLSRFGDMSTLFNASIKNLQQAGLAPDQIKAIQRPDWPEIEKDLRWCAEQACEVITLLDPRYPTLLKNTVGAPLVLFAQGNLELLHKPQIALVGSRHPTPAGQELAGQFASGLSQAGLVITSGLAKGIDAASHHGALISSGGTVAVLGNGLSHIYPACHKRLHQQILNHGIIISEFPPFMPPRPKHFPRRNRIISGLSLGVLVVEAALKSGSLITARYAMEQGREVFAIPGPVQNPLTRGCHYLLKQGAKLVENINDVLEELGPLSAVFLPVRDTISQPPSAELDVYTRQLLEHIDYQKTPLDVIILRSGLTAAKVSSMLLTLELEGIICRVPGGYVVAKALN